MRGYSSNTVVSRSRNARFRAVYWASLAVMRSVRDEGLDWLAEEIAPQRHKVYGREKRELLYRRSVIAVWYSERGL